MRPTDTRWDTRGEGRRSGPAARGDVGARAVVVATGAGRPARSRSARPRAALVWGLILFAAVQAASAAVVEWWRPEYRDPEYGHKLAGLRRRLRGEPGRPLAVVLGSSRVEMGFRPDVLPAYRPAGGPPALVHNFALSASGPVRELLALRRLLDAGIRPRWALIEVLGPILTEDNEDLR